MELRELKKRCTEAGCLEDRRFTASLERALPLVEKFCSRYSVSLVKVESTTENSGKRFKKEPQYVFSDKLGGYNIKGIKDSLKD